MSRVGQLVLPVPSGVKAEIQGNVLVCSGAKGRKDVVIPSVVNMHRDGDNITFTPANKAKHTQQLWGTTAALTRNALIGASVGFTNKLIVDGVGFRAAVKGKNLVLNVGFSHEVVMAIPEGVDAKIVSERPVVLELSGVCAQAVGQFGSEVRSVRPPEPYKGRGIRFDNEVVLRKEGKKK